ncbi:Sphingoid long-chain bases kinase [Arachis hypogaea]|nr:Sphingoid long-chain bases kinase [Arachis hypogaea]
MPPPQPQPQPPPPPPPLPQFECAKCGKSFPEKRRLEDHWRTKKLRKYIHICQHCNNRFETNANLEQHQIGVMRSFSPAESVMQSVTRKLFFFFFLVLAQFLFGSCPSQLPLSTTPNWPRTRSKSRNDKWTGLTTTHDNSRWGNGGTNDREHISSTLSDPGPIWDAEPKWDPEANWDVENPIELPGPPDDTEVGPTKEVVPRFGDKWVVSKGHFLGILVCNHACRTVQSSQVVAPKAEFDDNTLDMLLVHGVGRLRLLRFFVLMQMGRHLSLPYVEYVKVKSVRIKSGKHTHNGCGIDGELFPLNGQVVSTMLPEQCRLIGRSRIR